MSLHIRTVVTRYGNATMDFDKMTIKSGPGYPLDQIRISTHKVMLDVGCDKQNWVVMTAPFQRAYQEYLAEKELLT